VTLFHRQLIRFPLRPRSVVAGTRARLGAFFRQVQAGGTTMTDPRLGDQEQGRWAWVPGALFVICVVAGVAFWAYSTGDLERSVARPDRDATTGQSERPPLNPNPARPAPAETPR
jgi:hypothetical protein